ncbi:MAG: GntR family transcriptional regulator [bacterium]|nr:GntR family transcriptional regulator [bacterium]
MLLQLDFESETPIYQQIRNQIVIGIASGALRGGERLPTIRALAEESGVNMMTVSKAYQLLRQEGYIRADRRSGTIVCAGEGRPPVPAKTMETLRLCLSELRLAGMDEEESLALCRRLYGESRCAARENGGKPI